MEPDVTSRELLSTVLFNLMKKILFPLLALSALLFAACESDSTQTSQPASEPAPVVEAPAEEPAQEVTPVTPDEAEEEARAEQRPDAAHVLSWVCGRTRGRSGDLQQPSAAQQWQPQQEAGEGPWLEACSDTTEAAGRPAKVPGSRRGVLSDRRARTCPPGLAATRQAPSPCTAR